MVRAAQRSRLRPRMERVWLRRRGPAALSRSPPPASRLRKDCTDLRRDSVRRGGAPEFLDQAEIAVRGEPEEQAVGHALREE